MLGLAAVWLRTGRARRCRSGRTRRCRSGRPRRGSGCALLLGPLLTNLAGFPAGRRHQLCARDQGIELFEHRLVHVVGGIGIDHRFGRDDQANALLGSSLADRLFKLLVDLLFDIGLRIGNRLKDPVDFLLAALLELLDHLLTEVVPLMQRETGVSRIATAGCSFGGYHAINFAFRHPDRVNYAFSMGGAFDIKNHMDGHYDDNVFYNNPVDYLPGLNDENIYRMGIVIGAGEQDFCLPQNYRLAEIMERKGMNYWLDVRPNEVHDWPVWRRMLPDYFGRMNF